MLEIIKNAIGLKKPWNLTNVSGYILTRRKSEIINKKWRCVEKQTLPNVYSKEEALKTMAAQSFSGKEIKVDFEVVIIKNGAVRHCSGTGVV